MRKLEWSPDALEDLDVIWSYIAEDNVERASSFVEELQAQARKLVDAPWTGVIIPELNEEEYREKYYKGYTIVYEVLVLCQDLVQVKMRNFSHFNLPKAQP